MDNLNKQCSNHSIQNVQNNYLISKRVRKTVFLKWPGILHNDKFSGYIEISGSFDCPESSIFYIYLI